jgi:methenyltetrahydromethanopterin cyclohydrolase
MKTMNERAWWLGEAMAFDPELYGVAVTNVGGAKVIDASAGGLTTGIMLARVCMAELGTVAYFDGNVQVTTDHPVRACLASQYAGWQVKGDTYFAMGSGPMRAAAGREELFNHITGKETAEYAVGVLEAKKAPPEAVVRELVEKLGVAPEQLTLLFAPAASLAGTVQVVARCLETAIHKLHELKFDLTTIKSGAGIAPLPPVGKDELTAVGWTNDAILYGGRVTLWVRADDAVLEEIGPRVPSAASKDHGAPFADLFARYGDFYKIDPLLFSPAVVTFHNLASGRSHTFGRLEPGLLPKG